MGLEKSALSTKVLRENLGWRFCASDANTSYICESGFWVGSLLPFTAPPSLGYAPPLPTLHSVLCPGWILLVLMLDSSWPAGRPIVK